MAHPTATSVLNHDIVGIWNRINRFIEEMIKAVSSSLSQTSVFDLNRLESYLTAIDVYHNWVISQPQLDLPETHPHPWPLSEPPEVPHLENEELNDALRIMLLTRDELANSQSARMPSGLVNFDTIRLRQNVEKVRRFLADYIRRMPALDLPESSPQAPVSGPGRGGINLSAPRPTPG